MEPGLLARHAAGVIVEILKAAVKQRGSAVFVPSAGRTWLYTYAILRESYRTGLDWTRVICVQMDEYAGLGTADPRSFAFCLQREIVGPLAIGQFLRFYDSCGKLRLAPHLYEEEVRRVGGIDCAVHGVGMNGHIGLNEPAKTIRPLTRIVRLSRATRTTNDVTFTRGITLGLGILSEAKTSIVGLLGPHKRKAARNFLYGAVGPENPVAYLRSCGKVSIYFDQEAGADLTEWRASGSSCEFHSDPRGHRSSQYSGGGPEGAVRTFADRETNSRNDDIA